MKFTEECPNCGSEDIIVEDADSEQDRHEIVWYHYCRCNTCHAGFTVTTVYQCIGSVISDCTFT